MDVASIDPGRKRQAQTHTSEPLAQMCLKKNTTKLFPPFFTSLSKCFLALKFVSLLTANFKSLKPQAVVESLSHNCAYAQ